MYVNKRKVFACRESEREAPNNFPVPLKLWQGRVAAPFDFHRSQR